MLNVHLPKAPIQAYAKENLKSHSNDIVTVHIPWSTTDLVTGSFGIEQKKTGLEVILSMGCHVRIWDRRVSLDESIPLMSEDFGPGLVFALSIGVLLLWDKSGVRFEPKPLSTLWKFWGPNGSKQRLGTGLYSFLARLNKLTRLALRDNEKVDVKLVPLIIQ